MMRKIGFSLSFCFMGLKAEITVLNHTDPILLLAQHAPGWTYTMRTVLFPGPNFLLGTDLNSTECSGDFPAVVVGMHLKLNVSCYSPIYL